MKIDLLIVGAGFAGLACARQAAKVGLSVVILEKKASSGAKLHTTGILVKEVVEQVAWLQAMPPHLFRQIAGVRLYAPNMKALDLRAPGYFFYATETPGLLNWMADEVRAMGVTVLTSTLFEAAWRTEDGGWRVPVACGNANGHEQEIVARYLIGADGSTSRVARALGLSRNTEFVYGMEREYREVDLDADYLHCFIDQQLAPGYIGWGLTTQGYSQIGLAKRLPSQQGSFRGAGALQFERFVQKISPHIQIKSEPMAVRAGMIPCGGTLQHIACPGAMLVGDAAGTVSPVTAGGIRSALVCGEKVGVAVADFLQGRSDDPAQWLVQQYPSYRAKRVLRQCFDRWQSDWLFNRLLTTPVFKRAAEQIYFHRKGGKGGAGTV